MPSNFWRLSGALHVRQSDLLPKNDSGFREVYAACDDSQYDSRYEKKKEKTVHVHFLQSAKKTLSL